MIHCVLLLCIAIMYWYYVLILYNRYLNRNRNSNGNGVSGVLIRWSGEGVCGKQRPHSIVPS